MTTHPGDGRVVLASRGSKLALWQANFVADAIRAAGAQPEINVIKTTGDKVQDRFLHEIGGKGHFIRELEVAMAAGEADLAIHSLKDMPARLPEGFELPAVLKRHAPGDVLIFREDRIPSALPPAGEALTATWLGEHLQGYCVGTASLRRQAMLQSLGGIELVGVRGNVDTRLRKLAEGQWDALILAEASLDRLSLGEGRCYRRFAADWFTPSAAQGALAIECRHDNPWGPWIRQLLNDPNSERCVTLERRILAELGGDCTMPFGAHVSFGQNQWQLAACLLDATGQTSRWQGQGDLAESDNTIVNKALVGLAQDGAAAILRSLELPVPAAISAAGHA